MSGSPHTRVFKFVGQDLTLSNEFFSQNPSYPGLTPIQSDGQPVVLNGKIVKQHYISAAPNYIQKFHSYTVNGAAVRDEGTVMLPIYAGTLFNVSTFATGGHLLNAAAIRSSPNSTLTALIADRGGALVAPAAFIDGAYRYATIASPYGDNYWAPMSLGAYSK